MIKRFLTLLLIGAHAFYSLSGITATQAYLSRSELFSLAQEAWQSKIEQYYPLIHRAYTEELKHDGTHHVFYHAQKSEFRIVHDFLKEIYHFIYPTVNLNNFHFLRFWQDFPKTIDANQFIDTEEMGSPKDWNDNTQYLSSRMLSVNFSLFGSTKNYGNFGECTFKYFFSNKSIKTPDIEHLLKHICDFFGFDQKYIHQLIQLNKSIATHEGLLFQIFIPIHLVDRIAFAAQRLGTPYRNELLLPHYFNHEKKRYPALTPILDMYKNNPTQFGMTLDRLQGRLLFSQDGLLNPESGIELYRYSTACQKEVQKYERSLKKLTKQIFAQWLHDLKTKKIVASSALRKLLHKIDLSKAGLNS